MSMTLHATILYQLGIDHTKLTYRYSGRDYRLTDVYGNVVRDLIAMTQEQIHRAAPRPAAAHTNNMR